MAHDVFNFKHKVRFGVISFLGIWSGNASPTLSCQNEHRPEKSYNKGSQENKADVEHFLK